MVLSFKSPLGIILLASEGAVSYADDFANAVAAPLPASVAASVDSGTASGSLVKVSDASNTASIASGRLKLSGAAAATYRFDPVSGLVNTGSSFAIHMLYKHTSGNFEFGLYADNTASGNPIAGIYPINNQLQIQIGADIIEAYGLTAATDYELVIDYDGLRTRWLLKGGTEYTVWTEIYNTTFIAWPAISYLLVKNTNAVVEFDGGRIQKRYVLDTALTAYLTFYVVTVGADTFDPVITTSSGTATWQYGDLSADEVTNNVSHAIAGALKMLVRITNLNSANILTIDSSTDKLDGAIPAEIGNLVNLTILLLSNNTLDGAIPAEIGNLVNLTQLLLYSNALDGAIPAEIGNLVNLAYLYLYANALDGAIPAEIGNLVNLRILLLNTNTLDVSADFAGTLIKMQDLKLQDNALSQSEVDTVIDDIYANRASYTYATPALNIGGTNAAPSGTYAYSATPTTGKEKIYALVNDTDLEGFNKWTITYTA